MSDDRYPVHAPGWAAIDRAVGRWFPGQTPHQFTSARAYDLAGESPLPAVTVWAGDAPAHWLLVTYGLTELFEKSAPDPTVSGFGYELTLRLPRVEGEERPPMAGVKLLQAFGHFVLSRHGDFDSGHLVDLGGPLLPGEPATGLTAVMCVPDPLLGKIETVHGSVLFLTLWGLWPDELDAMSQWDMARKVGLVLETSPKVVTDPARASMRSDEVGARVFRRWGLGLAT